MGVLVILVSLGLLCTMYNMFNTVCPATAEVFSCLKTIDGGICCKGQGVTFPGSA
jgi:hypothetical protein